MVRVAGIPERVCVLVLLRLQGEPVFGELRSEPPVVTKLMWPASRVKRVIACAPASRVPSNAQINKRKRHPRPPKRRPRMPRLDGTLMRPTLRNHAALQL